MLKAVLFDMDGLIFDTESIYKQSWQYAATEQGLTITDDFYQQFIGVQDPECERILSEHFHDAIDMPRYKAVRDEHFHNLRNQGIALKPGFNALFYAIKQHGLSPLGCGRQAVLSIGRFEQRHQSCTRCKMPSCNDSGFTSTSARAQRQSHH